MARRKKTSRARKKSTRSKQIAKTAPIAPNCCHPKPNVLAFVVFIFGVISLLNDLGMLSFGLQWYTLAFIIGGLYMLMMK